MFVHEIDDGLITVDMRQREIAVIRA